MCAGRGARSFRGVSSKAQERGSKALKELAGEVAWELVIAAVIALIVIGPIGLPSIDLPDLPDLPTPPDWLATTFKWGKFALLGALAIAFVASQIDRRRKQH